MCNVFNARFRMKKAYNYLKLAALVSLRGE